MDKKRENVIREKTVLLILLLVGIAGLICLGQGKAVKAAETEEEKRLYTDSQGIIYTLYDNHTCYVTGYTNQIKDSITIPESILETVLETTEAADSKERKKQRYTVTGIGDSALAGCTTLKELKIPNSITQIGADVVKGCKNLKILYLLPVKSSLKAAKKDAVLTIKLDSGLLCGGATVVLEVDKKSLKEAVDAPDTDTITIQVRVKENKNYQTEKAVLHQVVLQETAIKSITKSGKDVRVKIKNPVSGFSCMKVYAKELKQTKGDFTFSFVGMSVESLSDTYKTDVKKALKKNKLKEKQIKIVRVSSLDDSVTADLSFGAEGFDGANVGSEVYVYRYQKSKKNFVSTAYGAYHVSKKGNITFSVNKGGTYLLSTKKLSVMAEPLRGQFFRQAGNLYYVDKNGSLAYGWKKIGKDYYYFDRKNGNMAMGGKVDGISLEKDGAAKQTAGAVDKIQTMIKARNFVNELTNESDSTSVKMQKCFRWIFQFPYYRYRRLKPIYQEKGWEVTFANDIFDHQKGCCVSEASALAFLFHECGVETVYVCHDTGHAWTEVDGRVYDPLFAEARGISGYYNVSYKQAKLYVAGKRKI